MTEKKKKILIADGLNYLKDEILSYKSGAHYEFIFTNNGIECLKLIHSIQPDLLIIDLLLPQMHAIEILKQIKREEVSDMGIIIMSFEVMMQNYQASIDWGADYFLNKPFEISFLFDLIAQYFDHTLKPAPFHGFASSKPSKSIEEWVKFKSRPYIRFWGTRGSISVSGSQYIRSGGNTSCLEICSGKDLVIIDAGTGIVPLAPKIDYNKFQEINVLISHTHLDHIIGFPFFDPVYMSEIRTNIWAPVSFEKDTKELFTDMLAYAFFPVKLEEMKGQITFKDLRDGSSIRVGEIQVDCCYTYHPGPTLGFKIHLNGRKIGYITDNELFIGKTANHFSITLEQEIMKPHLKLFQFLSDVDIIIHEAQYFDNEYKGKIGWGHSSISSATQFVKMLKTPQWYVTHHDPKHNDEILQMKFEVHKQLLLETETNCLLFHARDGLIVPF